MTSTRGTPWLRVGLAVGLAAVTAAGCGGGDPADGPRALIEPSEIFAAYGPCGPVPNSDVRAPEQAALPSGTIVTSVRQAGPVTRIEGYLPATPLDARAELERRAGIEVLEVEDEIVEAEVLVTTGTHRTYVQVTVLCETSSRVVAIVAAEADATDVPTPAGSPPSG